MSLFRLDASIRTEGSVTRAVADSVQSAWRREHPTAEIVRRDVGLEPVPATSWRDAVIGGFLDPDARSAEQLQALALASTLADELIAADAYLLAIPLYNFGVAQSAKAWLDLLVTEPRFGPGAPKLLSGRPAVLVTARGGGYGPGTPREGWDHASPWYRRIFTDVLELDLQVVEVELTLAAVNPAMAALRGHADQLLAQAHVDAEGLGRSLAERMALPAA